MIYVSKRWFMPVMQIRNIYKIRRFIDSDTCANIVRALILSCLDYCNLLFNGITQKNLVRLQKLQNKCVRLVNMQPRSCHITPLLMDLHWLRVSERIIFKTLLYVYKSLNGLCPQYMNDCLVVNRPHLGSVTTRSGHGLNLVVPKTHKCAGDRAFSVAAPQLWNKLPLYIRHALNVHTFKERSCPCILFIDKLTYVTFNVFTSLCYNGISQ